MQIPIHKMVCSNCGAVLAVFIAPMTMYSILEPYLYLDQSLVVYQQEEVRQEFEAYEREIEESEAIEKLKGILDGFMDSRSERICPKCLTPFDPLEAVKEYAESGEKDLLGKILGQGYIS